MNAIVRPDVLSQFRIRLPYAAGSSLRDDDLHGIKKQTVEQCQIVRDGRYNDWLSDPSIEDSMLLGTYIHGDKVRKFGGFYRLTHPIGVAHRSANRPDKPYLLFDPIKAVAKAFVAVHHDNPEDASDDLTEREIVVDLALLCWHGNPKFISDFHRDIVDLSDTPNLEPFARAEEQIFRARGMTGRAVAVRFDDKQDNTDGDELLVRTGVISDPAEILARSRLARDKARIVQSLPLPITEREKVDYLKKVESLEAMARNAFKEVAHTRSQTAIQNMKHRANSVYEHLARYSRLSRLSMFTF